MHSLFAAAGTQSQLSAQLRFHLGIVVIDRLKTLLRGDPGQLTGLLVRCDRRGVIDCCLIICVGCGLYGSDENATKLIQVGTALRAVRLIA